MKIPIQQPAAAVSFSLLPSEVRKHGLESWEKT